jgi:anti-sigma regulatory factor (Ser/Thr protein kinase)
VETAVELDLPVDHTSVREARRFVATIDGLAVQRLADAQLIVSELVTNALLHSGLVAGNRIHVTIVTFHEQLRIDVHDGGTFTADCETFGPSQPGSSSDSRGLRMVQTLATHWQADEGRVTAWLAL